MSNIPLADNTTLRIEHVRTIEGLEALRPAWDALSACAERASPFNSWVWVAIWWKVFAGGKNLHIFIVRDEDTVVAIAPFYVSDVRVGPIRLRLMLPIGFGNDLTERMEVLIAAGRRAEVLARLSAYLLRHRHALWHIMIWAGVRADELSPTLRRMVHEDDTRPFEVCSLPGTREAFVLGLSKSMRDNLKYYPRLLERHAHRADAHSATSAEAIGLAIEEFLRLHRMRAEATTMTPHDNRFSSLQHRRFLVAIAAALAQQGNLRVEFLAIDGVNVAAQIVLEQAGVLYIYYSGLDPRWQKYSVGMLTLANSMYEAVERNIRTVDFLMGTGQFKQRWGTHTESMSRLVLVSDAPTGRVAFAAYKRLQDFIARRGGLQPRGGVGPRLRVLRRVFRVFGQPTLG